MTHPLRWLFLDLNSYFASVEQQEQPALRGKPTAVVPMLVDSTCCIAASYEAKAFGVKTGTNVAEARRLCPQIRFIEGRHELYVKYHHAIVEAVESCLPVDVVMSIDEMAGRLHGSEQEPEKAIKLAQHIKETIEGRVGAYLKSSVGIAPNRFLAKVAGEMQKPDGLTVLTGDRLPEALHKLELRDLPGIGKNMEARLLRSGIRTMKQLCAAPDETMREIWGGVGGERFAAWLRGEDLEIAQQKNRSIGHSHVLEPAARNKKGAFRVAQQLTAKAAYRLRRMGYWASGFHLAVRFKNDSYWQESAKIDDTQDTPTFLEHLGTWWEEFPSKVPVWVGVTMAPLVPPDLHTRSLFTDPKRETLSKVMDAINGKYGKNTATFATLNDLNQKTASTRIAFQSVPNLDDF
jgi:DNA polymerase-4